MNLEELKKEQQPKIKEIWNHYTDYGKNTKSQRLMLLEELSELQAKLFKVSNDRIKIDDIEVLNEFADVLIMLAQFEVDVWDEHKMKSTPAQYDELKKWHILKTCDEIMFSMPQMFRDVINDTDLNATRMYFYIYKNTKEYFSIDNISQIYSLITDKLDRQLKRIENEKSGKYCGNCKFEEDKRCTEDLIFSSRVSKFDYCDDWDGKDEKE